MNLGISTQGNTWKRIKNQHIIAAAGVALAVSAVIGGVAIRDSGSSSSAPRSAAPASVSQPAPQPQTFVYVVGSQAEAIELQNAFTGAALESGVDTYRHVMVVDSAETEEGLQIMQGELLQAGTADSVTIVDLRPGAPAAQAFSSRSDVLVDSAYQVQEQSHPLFAFETPGPQGDATGPGAYPLVQEMSNP